MSEKVDALTDDELEEAYNKYLEKELISDLHNYLFWDFKIDYRDCDLSDDDMQEIIRRFRKGKDGACPDADVWDVAIRDYLDEISYKYDA